METKTEWMLDVLDDLIFFCTQNGIKGEAIEQLNKAKQALVDELQCLRLKKQLKTVSENQLSI